MLLNKGYISRKGQDYIGYSCKPTPEIIYYFGISFQSKSKCYEIDGLGARLGYTTLINIVDPILQKNNLFGQTDTPHSISFSTAYNHFYSDECALLEFNKKYLPLRIYNETDIPTFISVHHEFFERFVEPFFSKWSDMRKLLPYLENATPRETSQILGYGYIFAKYTIWKLCNHPRYESEIERSITGFKKQAISNPLEIECTRFLNSAIDLQAALSQIEPLYEWDESYLQRK